MRRAVRLCHNKRLTFTRLAIDLHLFKIVAVNRHLLHCPVIEEQPHLVRIVGNVVDFTVVSKADIADIRKGKGGLIAGNEIIESVLCCKVSELSGIGFHDSFRTADFVLIIENERTSVKVIGYGCL